MRDLTKNTVAFGLLDEESRDALEWAQTNNVPIQVYASLGWRIFPKQTFSYDRVYRLKPEHKTITVYGRFAPTCGVWVFDHELDCRADTHTITFELDENGEPDCTKPARVEKLNDDT